MSKLTELIVITLKGESKGVSESSISATAFPCCLFSGSHLLSALLFLLYSLLQWPFDPRSNIVHSETAALGSQC